MNSEITAVIVDDERLARQALKNSLKEFPRINIIGEANSIEQAVEVIGSLNPDVIFLDIQLQGETGFDLFDRMEISSKVIFVTAHDSFALRAFEVNALDYLLKPVSHIRLAGTLERLFNNENNKNQGTREYNYEDKVLISSNSKIKFIKLSSIASIVSSGDYTQINLESGTKHMVNISLNNWEQKLPANDFCRIHRSTIVNINFISNIEKGINGSYLLYLNTNVPFTISKRYAQNIKEKYSFIAE